MKYIHGQNMKIYVRNVMVACATDCDISIDIDNVETLPTEDWRWSEFIEGKRTWSASTGGLVAIDNGFELSEYFDGLAQTLDFACTVGNMNDPNSHAITYSGKAIPTSCSISSSTKGLLKYKLSLQGSGKLKVVGKVFEAKTAETLTDNGFLMQCPLDYEFALQTTTGKLFIGAIQRDGEITTARYYSQWCACRYPSSEELNSENFIIIAGGNQYHWDSAQQKWIQNS